MQRKKSKAAMNDHFDIEEIEKQSVQTLFKSRQNTRFPLQNQTDSDFEQTQMSKSNEGKSITKKLIFLNREMNPKCSLIRKQVSQGGNSLKSTNGIEKNFSNLNFRYKSKHKSPSGIIKNKGDAPKNQKITRICQNLISKLKRNNIFSSPISQEDFKEFQQPQEATGFTINDKNLLIYECLGTLFLLFSFFVYSLALIFYEVKESRIFRIALMVGVILFLIEIFMKLFMKNGRNVKKLKNMRQICQFLLQNGLILDITIFICLVSLLISPNLIYLEIVVLLFLYKIGITLDKLTKIQMLIVQNFHYEKYWSLFKLVLFNFAFAHLIAVLFNLMAKNNPERNWQMVKGIDSSSWTEKYIWSYYWATTIMLSVGFGDIAPSCSQEAIWVIFIEIASCIAFSYNLSCLAKIIAQIKGNSETVEKNRKIFHKIAEDNCLSKPLVQKVENYINESIEVKKKFNIEEENGLVAHLPSGLRKEVHCERNFNLLRGLTFFGELLKSSIFNIADKMERQIYTPNEVVKKRDSLFEVSILEVGEIGYAAKKLEYCGNGLVSNTVKVHKSGKPFLISLDFITQSRGDFEVKSVGYSVVHKIGYEQLLDELRKHPKDHEYYCYLKDKSKHIIDEFETVKCSSCAGHHLFFLCPKFHFIPIRSHVVEKHLTQLKKLHNPRNKLDIRDKLSKTNTLLKFSSVNQNAITYSATFKNLNSVCFDKMTQDKKTMKAIITYLQKDTSRRELQLDQAQSQVSLEHSDSIWILTTDKLFNYSIYFPSNNASNYKSNQTQSYYQSNQKPSSNFSKVKKLIKSTFTPRFVESENQQNLQENI